MSTSADTLPFRSPTSPPAPGRLAAWGLSLRRVLALGWHVGRAMMRLGWRQLRRPWIRSRVSAHQVTGEVLTELLEALGPTYIKIGQILSSRPDLLPPELAASLARLQDRVAPFPGHRAELLLEEALGRPCRRLFRHFDPEPLAAGSIAQVHRAILADGTEVAVKIRRPDAVRIMEADFRLVHGLVSVIARLPALRVVPLEDLVREIEIPVRQQLDFHREAENNRRLRANFEHVEGIRVPRLFDQLCCESVLTLEYLGDLQKVTHSRLTEDERQRGALAGLRALYKMIFRDGFIHADLHPGNVFLRADGELVILDTGLMTELTDDDLQEFVEFFFAMINDQGAVAARIVRDGATYLTPGFDPAAFEASMCDLISRHAALRSQDFNVTHFAAQLMEVQRRHGVRGSTKFIMTILSMVVYDGICKLLYPSCDFQKEARGYLIAAKYRNYRAAAV